MRRRDVDRSRDDLSVFAKLVRWPLAKWQAASLRLEARTSYIVGPRQSGKSRSAALVAAWRAIREPGHHVLIVSASELGAKRLLATIADLVVNSPMLTASVVDEQASLIRLTNGSSIRSVPASVKAIRGWSIDTLIFDEATELGDEIIDLATPTAGGSRRCPRRVPIEVEQAELAWRDAVGHAIRAGKLLIEAKSQVRHGEWLPWLEANFPGSERSAQDYMRLARHAEDARRVADLGVRGALKELAAPGAEDARSVADSESGGVAEAEDQMQEIMARYEAEKPTQDDLHRQVAEEFPDRSKRDRKWIAEARYHLALIEHNEDYREALARVVVAHAGDYIAADPAEGPLVVAWASTAIAFLRANRACERAPEGEYDERYAAAQKAWMVHRAARDAVYRADGEPPMDERPIEPDDWMYHPDLQEWRDTADDDEEEE